MAMEVDGAPSIGILPEEMIGEVLSKLSNPVDLANAASVNRAFRSNCCYSKAMSYVFHLKSIRIDSGAESPVRPTFKETFARAVLRHRHLESLSLEVADDGAGKRLKGDLALPRGSLWFSEGPHLETWIPQIGANLRKLTLADYGPQAIFQTTPLLHILAAHCKHLRELELRNMFLDSRHCPRLDRLEKLTLRCVKLQDDGLADLNECAPGLRTLVLLTVVGLKRAVLNSSVLEVLCLGLNTRLVTLRLRVPSLRKLQLKMACPDEVKVTAPQLRALTVSMNRRNDETVDLDGVEGLEELLVGASDFCTIRKLSSVNRGLKRVFLDVPCLHFDETGAYKGVSQALPRSLPSVELVRTCWSRLEVLSVGPGLWYALERDGSGEMEVGSGHFEKWHVLGKLIVHLVVVDLDRSYRVLSKLVQSMAESLESLDVYVHQHSVEGAGERLVQLGELFPSIRMRMGSWRKGLNFDCFESK